MRKAAAVVVLLAILSSAASGAETQDQPAVLSLAWHVTIDAQGHVTGLVATPNATADRLPQVREGVAAAVRGWTFVPGQVDGHAAVTESELTVDVSLSAQADGSARVRIDDARTGARYDRLVPPRYPTSAVLHHVGGLAVLHVTYDADGKVVSAELADGAPRVDEALAQAAITAARKWTLRAERVAGHGVPGDALVPICFMVGSSARCEKWTPHGSSARLGDGELLALDPVLRLASDVAGRTL